VATISTVAALVVLGVAAAHVGPSTGVSMGLSAARGTAGMAETGAASTSGSGAGPRQATWRFERVDDPADPTFTQVMGVDNGGRIVGVSGSGADTTHPKRGFAARAPFAAFAARTVPGAAQTQAVAINNSGMTVGFSVDPAGVNTGFVESHGRFTTVVDPQTSTAHPFNQLFGVNDHGVAVGICDDARGLARAYRYDTAGARFTPITLPVRADSVIATGINDAGDVSGVYTSRQTSKGFRLDHTGAFRSLSFGGHTGTQALGINRAGQVVGAYLDARGQAHGFLDTGRRMVTVDVPAGTRGSVVSGLNDRGQLVGFYIDVLGLVHGFLATPSRQR
jgi:hypothetical protein